MASCCARIAAYAEKAARIAALAKDITEVMGELGLPPAATRHRPGRRLSLRLLDAARPEDHRPAQAAAGAGRASRSRTCRRAISAAARPAPTTSCSPRSPAGCATARSPTSRAPRPSVIATGNIGCITQIALGHRDPGRAHRRAARLGHRRAADLRRWQAVPATGSVIVVTNARDGRHPRAEIRERVDAAAVTGHVLHCKQVLASAIGGRPDGG